jgi:predicted RNA binding protein YcfA (HicA-like mRNA interferase family)
VRLLATARRSVIARKPQWWRRELDRLDELRNMLRTAPDAMPTIETNTRKVVARLRAEGWVYVVGGKHDKFEHAEQPDVLIIVPRHKQLSPGVARSIARLAGWI